MPGRDGTGTYGMGPRTGSGFGPCGGGYPMPPYAGYGCGFGRGRGYRAMRGGYPVAPVEMDPKQEKAMLEDLAKFLEDQLDQVKQQLIKFDKKE